ncbi:MAG: hypothetical protein FRX49_00614 [Trebouxia sp. A1-2]|nr:MAG: hypothetical protein FRX49_00614 [Trebouxia sp. A1-2]
MGEKPSTVDEAIAYVWDVPDTVIGPADKQSLAAALAEKTDAVARRYFSAPNPELWVGTLRQLLKPTGPPEKMIDIRQQLARIEAATLNTFHHMFAPSISDLSQRSKLVKRICTTTYNANDRPAGQLWMIKTSHIYKRDWPAHTAALLKLDVDTAANLFSAQKKIKGAFDKFRLIIVPNNLSDYILHVLDPSLGSEMINNTILNASGAAVKFADIDGAALQFVTETCPAKRAFAWHAEEALHFGKAVGWPAASLLTVPPSAWSSDTCDSSIRDQYFHDLLKLQAASVSDPEEGLHD